MRDSNDDVSVDAVARASTILAAAAFFGAFAFGATTALAGDDGQAPMWVGVASIFGLDWGSDNNKGPIDYREHGKIVLPPKMDLPPPGSPAVKSAVAWPVDPDIQKRAKEKEAAKARPVEAVNGYVPVRRNFTDQIDPNAVVTVRATAGQGPGGNCPDGQCQSSAMAELNPLGWFGGDKKALGPEPPREWLTDPPKGYRAPYSPSTTAQAEPQTAEAPGSSHRPAALEPTPRIARRRGIRPRRRSRRAIAIPDRGRLNVAQLKPDRRPRNQSHSNRRPSRSRRSTRTISRHPWGRRFQLEYEKAEEAMRGSESSTLSFSGRRALGESSQGRKVVDAQARESAHGPPRRARPRDRRFIM